MTRSDWQNIGVLVIAFFVCRWIGHSSWLQVPVAFAALAVVVCNQGKAS